MDLYSATLEDLNREDSRLTREIAKLYDSLADVRCRMNTFTSVSRLPPEILLELFRHALWGSRFSGKYKRTASSLPQVCRLWRTIALGSPKLWSYIVPCSETLSSSMILRAANQPLRIVWDTDQERPTALDHQKCLDGYTLYTTIAPNTNRIVELDLTLRRGSMEDVARCIMEDHWECLQRLALSYRGYENYVLDLHFAGHPPSDLRHLEFTNVVPKQCENAGVYRNIRSLRFLLDQAAPAYTTTLPTMSQLMDVLRHCGRLEELLLCRFSARPLSDHGPALQSSPEGIVDLQRLRVLKIVDVIDVDISHLLAHLVIPEATQVLLRPSWRPSSGSRKDGYLSCLPLPNPDVNVLFLRSVTVLHIHGPAMTRSIPEVIAYKDSYPGANTSSFHVRRYLNSARRNPILHHLELSTIFRNTLPQLGPTFRNSPLCLLKLKLPLSFMRSVTPQEWDAVFSDLPSLKALRYHRLPEEPSYGESPDYTFLLPLLFILSRDERRVTPLLKGIYLQGLGGEIARGLQPYLRRCMEVRMAEVPSFQVFVDRFSLGSS
ncbi:hypothetical protein BXZ70DRAFT_955789 [Cristinia sonorae]|uniref:F-box domain-containing protein n=1 Tax=Cristinia sonorae TaxID=1940300 RepID=A0A8K0UG31_9AGAR|nr:hypothetical protein BXZ70DRAFT_955789 [Cristinia sonorae]